MKHEPSVVYYGHSYPLTSFEGRGVRGWWIRVLARVQAWLARAIEWHVMKLLAKRYGADRKQVSELERMFKTEHGELPDMELPPRSDKYREGRLTSNDRGPTYREARKKRAQEFFAAYMGGGRDRRYKYARDQRLTTPDEQFELVPARSAEERNRHAPAAEGQATQAASGGAPVTQGPGLPRPQGVRGQAGGRQPPRVGHPQG